MKLDFYYPNSQDFLSNEKFVCYCSTCWNVPNTTGLSSYFTVSSSYSVFGFRSSFYIN
jgi:hypothetical protein